MPIFLLPNCRFGVVYFSLKPLTKQSNASGFMGFYFINIQCAYYVKRTAEKRFVCRWKIHNFPATFITPPRRYTTPYNHYFELFFHSKSSHNYRFKLPSTNTNGVNWKYERKTFFFGWRRGEKVQGRWLLHNPRPFISRKEGTKREEKSISLVVAGRTARVNNGDQSNDDCI